MGIFKRMQDEVGEREKRDGISPVELLELAPPQRRLVRHMMRQGETGVEEAAELVGVSPEEARDMLNELVEKSYLDRVEREGRWYYQVHLARKRGRQLPPGIWSALDSRTEKEQ